MSESDSINKRMEFHTVITGQGKVWNHMETNQKDSCKTGGEWNQKKIIIFACAGIGVYITFRYFFPLVSPFLLSFCLVYLLNPRLERAQKRTHIKREFLMAGILLLTVSGVLLVLWALLQFAAVQAGELSRNWDGISTQVSGQIRVFLGDCCLFVEDKLGIDASRVEQIVLERVDIFVEELRVEFVPKLMTESWWYARKLISVGAFLGVTFIASLLLCRDFPEMMKRLGMDKEKSRLVKTGFEMLESVLHLAVAFLKTQGIIMLLVALVCSIGLSLAKVGSAVLLGCLAGILDALPFIGTGIVLIPTAIWQLICGRYGTAGWCVVIYLICVGVREWLEPRLMGEKTGIYPVFMLLAVYAGVKLFGIAGILKGPLAMVVWLEIVRKYGERD